MKQYPFILPYPASAFPVPTSRSPPPQPLPPPNLNSLSVHFPRTLFFTSPLGDRLTPLPPFSQKATHRLPATRGIPHTVITPHTPTPSRTRPLRLVSQPSMIRPSRPSDNNIFPDPSNFSHPSPVMGFNQPPRIKNYAISLFLISCCLFVPSYRVSFSPCSSAENPDLVFF